MGKEPDSHSEIATGGLKYSNKYAQNPELWDMIAYSKVLNKNYISRSNLRQRKCKFRCKFKTSACLNKVLQSYETYTWDEHVNHAVIPQVMHMLLLFYRKVLPQLNLCHLGRKSR